MDWEYSLDFDKIDTPALLIDREKVARNIVTAIDHAGDLSRLRPHVKTHKMLEVAQMQLTAGISKFKCATIAEAEMLAIAGAADVLIAYQPQGPKMIRVAELIKKYPKTTFSILIDNISTAESVNHVMNECARTLDIYFDINAGHDRSGIKPQYVDELAAEMRKFSALHIKGLHCYDGHIRMSSLEDRRSASTKAFESVFELKSRLENTLQHSLTMVAGGSPSFTGHAMDREVECSPGTWIFWDQRYGEDYQEQKFEKAAVVATRVISQIDEHTFCLDLGHKSIASEFPFPRVKFIGFDGLTQVGHSEEHLVVKSSEPDQLKVGQLLLGYPYHICPTVALYDHAHVISDGKWIDSWKVIARERQISI